MTPVILADADGAIIAFIFAVVFGVAKYIAGKSKSESPPPQRPLTPNLGQGAPTNEEERTRRFLEALGMPADGPVARPSREPMAPLRPATSKPPRREWSGEMPSPPIVPQPRRQIDWKQVEQKVAPAPVRPPQRTYLPPPFHSPPSLVTPELPPFHTLSSEVTAIPFEKAFPKTKAAARPARAALAGDDLDALLRSPQGLRNALIMREILGPPRGLPSAPSPHIFPSL